jgi:alanyl-tRNA synthetase
MTEKLYYNDPYTLEFTADITEIQPYESGKYAVFLDKTFFYPASGGQPYDTGILNGIKVVDVFEKEGKIFHITEAPLEKGKAEGKIDYHRRLEHMQHHTGQHLLSQAFIQVIKAPTVSFHLGNETATIEIVIPDLSIEQADAVEDLANDIIYRNKKINVLYIEEADVNDLNLRKKPKKKCAAGDIRVIEIEDFDLSPCGGTHATSTGELGIIKIINWERYKGNVRVNFLCGRRALHDFRNKNRSIKNISAKFSASDQQIEEIIYKSIDDTKELQKQFNAVKKQLAEYTARGLIKRAEQYNEYKLIIQDFPETDISTLKQIGQELTLEKDILAFLVSKNNHKTHLLFCCSENIKINLNEHLGKILIAINGKGGGKPNFVQGSGDATDLNGLVEQIKKLL